jgi:hypothetical protein
MSSKKNIVWKFTNGKELNKKEFMEYFEKKIFKTIRKFEILKDRRIIEIPISKEKDLNTQVLNNVLSEKFSTKLSNKPLFSYKNLSDLAEEIFSNVLKGKFKKDINVENMPLCFLSDKEVEIYAKLKRIKGTPKKRDKGIQEFFNKFMGKNPDLEHNVLNAFKQMSHISFLT